MRIEHDNLIIILSFEELDKAYEEQRKYYHKIDAQEHCDNYLMQEDIRLVEPLNDTDYEWLADAFDKKYDADVADNTTWYSVVKEYIDKLAKVDIEDAVKQYLLHNATNEQIENFLGYQISANVLESLEEHVDEILSQLPSDELIPFYDEYYQAKEN